MKVKIIIILIFFVFFGYQQLWANNAGAFLESGFGSRPIGLGKTFVAVADDANALYWNAAGLAFLKSSECTFMYAKMFEETTNLYTSYVLPIGEYGSLGVGLIRVTVDGIANTDNLGNLLGYISNIDQAVCISYSKILLSNLSLGLNLKMISQTLGNNSNNGYDLDLSALYKITKTLTLGINLQNALEGPIGPDKFNQNIKVGMAYFPFDKKLILAMDLNTNKNRTKSNYGLEWIVASFLKLRTGTSENKLFGGIGIDLRSFTFDYSFNSHDLGNVNTFSITAHL